MNDHPALIFAAAMIFTYGLFSKIADRFLSPHPWYLWRWEFWLGR